MPAEKEILRPKLKEAQKALEAALEEACDADVSGADSADLIRLEESLTAARDAARNTIAVLARFHGDRPESEEAESDTHRVFVDDRGVQWDAFAVYPSRATTGRQSLPAPYHEGWLSLQCQDEIRRSTPIPEGWRELPRDAMCELLHKAASAPRRTRPRDTTTKSESRPTRER